MSAHGEIENLKSDMALANARMDSHVINLTEIAVRVKELKAGHTELGNLLVRHGDKVNSHDACIQRIEREDRTHLVEFKAIEGRAEATRSNIETFKRETHYRMTEHTKEIHLIKQDRSEFRELWTGLSTRVHALEDESQPVVREALAWCMSKVAERLEHLAWQIGGAE